MQAKRCPITLHQRATSLNPKLPYHITSSPQDVCDAFEKKTSLKLDVNMPTDKTTGKIRGLVPVMYRLIFVWFS